MCAENKTQIHTVSFKKSHCLWDFEFGQVLESQIKFCISGNMMSQSECLQSKNMINNESQEKMFLLKSHIHC